MVMLRDLVPFKETASGEGAALLEHDTAVIVDDYSFSLTADEGARLKCELGEALRANEGEEGTVSWRSWFSSKG